MYRRLLFRMIVHITGWTPAILLLFHALTNNLSINPIQEITKRLGRAAILLLFLSLSATPIFNLSGLSDFLRHRRTLGLYAFAYTVGHLLVFSVVDYGLNLNWISQQITKKPYILIGFLAFCLLSVLAVSSFRPVIRFLGVYWKRVHRGVYFIAVLTIIHYGFATKGNILGLTGDIWKPFLYFLIFFILMVLRIRIISTFLRNIRENSIVVRNNFDKNGSGSGKGISIEGNTV
jgi:methionine sulfoxide reductase heme-binding subunit